MMAIVFHLAVVTRRSKDGMKIVEGDHGGLMTNYHPVSCADDRGRGVSIEEISFAWRVVELEVSKAPASA